MIAITKMKIGTTMNMIPKMPNISKNGSKGQNCNFLTPVYAGSVPPAGNRPYYVCAMIVKPESSDGIVSWYLRTKPLDRTLFATYKCPVGASSMESLLEAKKQDADSSISS